jgi:hypothetical protein
VPATLCGEDCGLGHHELEKVVPRKAHAASRHALARHELEKAMDHEAHAVSLHALAWHELEKAVDCEAHMASHHALVWHELEKAVGCEAQAASRHALAQACGRHKLVNIPPLPQQLSPDVHHSELAMKHSIQCPFCARG